MATLNDVSQVQYDAAETAIISLIRAAYPTLDLRRGTVLRDILIRPAAAVYALNAERVAELETRTSLIALTEAPQPVDPEWANAILANFSMALNPGALSAGQVIVRVDADRQYTLASGFRLISLAGLVFVTTQQYTIRSSPDLTGGELQLLRSTDGTYYYFILPVVSEAAGAQYNLQQGEALDLAGALFGFISAETYTEFSGGLDSETLTQAISRMPVAVSYRALESRNSIEARLRDNFTGTAVSIQALSSQGYGDRTQLRDKHNPMGFACGSRVDVYARNFTSPAVKLLRKTGVRIGSNTYRIGIAASEAPGYYAIRSISEQDSALDSTMAFGQLPVLGSYAFTEVRSASGIADTFHDIDPDNGMIETAYSIYQKSTIIVTGVPASTDTHEFKVEVYYSYGIDQLQSFVDDPDIRNLEADYIVRCPMICMVSVDATVYHSARYSIDIAQMRKQIHDYINTRSFIRRLTRSEITCILHGAGATRIDLGPAGMMLQGRVRDASGVLHLLQGDTLDLESVATPQALLSPETTVFAVELSGIHLQAVAE